jgi:glycosyltransferase involved in cell wall biosynthesis
MSEYYPHTEIIVIDGGSTDDTINILRRYDNRITYWVSEPDKGAADAINKGLRVAKGEIIRYFSDDDEMLPGHTHEVVQFMMNNPDVDIVAAHANIYRENEDGSLAKLDIKQLEGKITYKDFPYATGWIIHENTFFRKSVFDTIGPYDTSIKYSFDVELWWRALKMGKTFYGLPLVISNRYLQPTSGSQIGGNLIFREFEQIYKQRAPRIALYRFYYEWLIKSKIGSAKASLFKQLTKVIGSKGLHIFNA